MNRKGLGFFMPMLTLGVLLLLAFSLGLLKVNQWDDSEKPKIGEFPDAIFGSQQKAGSLQEYSDAALHLATQKARDDFLQEPSINYEDYVLVHYSQLMREHDLIDSSIEFRIQKIDRVGNEHLEIKSSEINIPIVKSNEELQTSNTIPSYGFLTVWPFDQSNIISSIFGLRKFTNEPLSSPNHPGMDIVLPFPVNAENYPVLAVAPGKVTGDPEKNITSLELNNGWICEYHNVVPDPDITSRVTAGQQIGTLGLYRAGYQLDLRCHNPELTPEIAKAIFGDLEKRHKHIGGAFNSPKDKTYFALDENEEKAYIDPYCLFSPFIRNKVKLEGRGLEGDDFPAQFDDSICQVYLEHGIIEATQRPEIILDSGSRYERTHKILETATDARTGKPLINLILEESEQAEVDPTLLIAMITQESGGNVGAISKTGVCGVMQFTCKTLKATLSDSRTCGAGHDPEWHCDSGLQIKAGAKFIRQLMDKYEGYTHQVAFMAAEYNGGPVVKQVAGDAPGLSYDQAMSAMTIQDLKNIGGTYSTWSDEQLSNKLVEISNHGKKVASYYQDGGGIVPAFVTSSNVIGTYGFELESETEISTEIKDLVALRDWVVRCAEERQSQQDCETLIESIPEIEVVNPYESQSELISLTVDACSIAMRNEPCNCFLPKPIVDPNQAEIPIDYSSEFVSHTYIDSDGNAHSKLYPVAWVLDGEDLIKKVLFSVEATDQAKDRVRVYENEFARDLVTTPTPDKLWYNYTETKNNMIINFYEDQPIGKVCEVPTFQKYKLKGTTSIVVKHDYPRPADRIPPVISNPEPSGTLSPGQIAMKVETDVISTCKYDNDDVEYSQMTNNLLPSADGLSHDTILTYSTGNYQFYVRCSNEEGIENPESTIISFSVS